MTQSTPRILQVKEKHGTYYYDISTVELRNKTFYTLLKERKEQGWYWEDGDPRTDPKFTDALNVSKKLLEENELPLDVKDVVQRKVASMEDRIEEHEQNARWWVRAKKLFSLPEEEGIAYRPRGGFVNEAEWLMHDLINHEYQGFDIISIQKL